MRLSDKISYVALIMCTSLSLSSCTTKEPMLDGPVPKTLVLGLDGIPLRTFQKMQDGGYFRTFNPVAPMVASFPSISDPNWSRLYGLPPERGYTKAYFDPTVKTRNGQGREDGGLTSHFKRHPKYDLMSDFRLDGAWEHLSMLIWTETTAYYWLEALERDFFKFRGRDTYFAIIINSDIMTHTLGEKRLMQYLEKVDQHTERLQRRYKEMYGQDLEVIMVSDHGNSFLYGEDVPYEESLNKQGWKVRATIAGPRDVAFYVPEMLSFGAFYCQPGSTRDLAQAMAQIPHVNVSAYLVSPSEIRIIGLGAQSEVQVTVDEAKQTVNYKVLRGQDPLNQATYFKKGPLSIDKYFVLSLKDTYPYAAVRLWEAFTKNSQTKPQVVVDPSYGYVFGNKALRLITEFRGFASTHGSLHHEQTMGIFASTRRSLPAIRPDDFKNHVSVRNYGKIVTSTMSRNP
ncbi:MAG: hypothetical protein IT289_00345 [Oligoflexia bacterium]|nr:hypothetical protein [Oligoflexia bacterium]